MSLGTRLAELQVAIMLLTRLPAGKINGAVPDLAAAIQEYYEARGWNEDGTVPDDALDSPVQEVPADSRRSSTAKTSCMVPISVL